MMESTDSPGLAPASPLTIAIEAIEVSRGISTAAADGLVLTIGALTTRKAMTLKQRPGVDGVGVTLTPLLASPMRIMASELAALALTSELKLVLCCSCCCCCSLRLLTRMSLLPGTQSEWSCPRARVQCPWPSATGFLLRQIQMSW